MQQILEDLKNLELREVLAGELRRNNQEDCKLEAQRILEAR